MLCFGLHSQQNNLLGQYYKAIQVYAPGLNGAQEYLDVALGSRKQWTSVNNAPSINVLNISGKLNVNRRNPYRFNSARVSNLSPYRRKNVKLGVGGYVINSNYGSLVNNSIMGVFSTHILVAENSYLSIGASFGFRSQNLDIANISVLYPDNDVIYQEYLRNDGKASFFDTNVGLSYYSSSVYFSYTLMKAVSTLLGGYTSTRESDYGRFDHNFLGGLRLSVHEKLDIIPNFFFRYSDTSPSFLDVGVRASYMNGFLAGMSYRTDGSIIAMLGLEFKKTYELGYAFEFKEFSSDFDVLNTHEITLGVKLFDHKTRKPVW
ncbi:hypothetical protein GCM10011506_47350 [Marivirga lumbricoides]|uniref:Type IX secretion system membrane protein PorP/SprF n=2 Tax=Marivirga lumbricoides TaxID=1046115 RepID=A0ABQ1N7J3_9BACT|nr:hypothetical protein GCM10011506_47350 [Marivirga lumbricoides]